MQIGGTPAGADTGAGNRIRARADSVANTVKTEWNRVLDAADYVTTQLPQWSFVKKIKHRPAFDSIWSVYHTSPASPTGTNTADELRTKLAIDADWHGASSLKSFTDLLEKQGLANTNNFAFMEQIARQSGTPMLDRISQSLTDYYSSYPSPGDEQKGIIQDALHDLAYPSHINQENKDTCTATAVQMKLAIERPLQYVQMLTTLARDQAFKLSSGEPLKPDNVWRADTKDNRSYSCKVMENALLQLGRKILMVERPYDSISDDGGLGPYAIANVVQKVMGQGAYGNRMLSLSQSLYKEMEDDLARNRTVVVCFTGHAVLAVGIDKSQSPAKVILDSWGKQFSMTVDEFLGKVQAVCSFNDAGPNDRETPAGRKTVLGDSG